MKNNKKIDVLGTEYNIVISKDREKYPVLYEAIGETCFANRQILVNDLIEEQYEARDSEENSKMVMSRVTRHEIIHAFLYESGLNSNSFDQWARNEEMVDYFAIQMPKMYKAFKELDILE